MKKNSKKVLVSLAATMFIASSVGHAGGFNYNINRCYNDYNNKCSRKTCTVKSDKSTNNYLQNLFGNKMIIRYTPKSWDLNEDTDKPAKPWDKTGDIKTDGDITKEENNNSTTTDTNVDKPNTSEDTNIDANIGDNTSVEKEVVRLVNIERQKEGLKPLTYSAELSKVARTKSQDMANKNYFSHNSPTYGDPFAMMKEFGIQYRTAGENIAKGYPNPESVVRGWMNSSGHRANILNPSFGTIGVGYVKANGTTYWTQMFTD